jgi:signal transduction histidine kinase
MNRASPYVRLVKLCLLVGCGILAFSTLIPGLRAQPAVPSATSSGPALLVTNITQLAKLFKSSPRIIAEVRLEVLVCSASRAEIGVVAVTDETGSEILELGPHKTPIAAGDVLRIEGRRCLLRKREMGVEITRAPDLDNDGVHVVRRRTVEENLTAGLHAFQLDYFNYLRDYVLELTCRMPDGSVQTPNNFLVRPGGGGTSESNMVAGVEATYYEGGWLLVPDFSQLQPVKTETATNLSLNLSPGSQTEFFGVRFKGFFSAPTNGTYAFTLASDDGSLLFLDTPEVPLIKLGRESIPPPTLSSLHARMTDFGASQWTSVEGRVDFVSRFGQGLRFELRSGSDSVWVTVADARELDPLRLQNSRIRVAGIGRASMTQNRELVLGELTAATSDNITILEDSARPVAEAGTAGSYAAINQIQSLSKEEAARHLPVKIQGFVTSLAPSIFRFMSVQDETRGVFVRLSPSTVSNAVAGDLCEVVGHTDVGDFAPIVEAAEVIDLGPGQMPPAARPSWKELLNGSMDVQWVEIQGVVTAVKNNSLALILPEGKLQVDEVDGYCESQLKTYEGAVIRLRGVLFAQWNTNRTVQVGHLLMRNATISVDAFARSDPFDVDLKSWSELYQFDPRATPFQRVKVRGTVIYSDSNRVFIMDRAKGIRISPAEPAKVRFGEGVEVVGYPDISGPAPLLREAVLRATGETEDPTPLVLDGSDLMLTKVDSMLVRITATLMGIHTEKNSRVLEMNASGHLFLAYVPDTERSESLRIGSQLGLTGVYVGKTLTEMEGSKESGFELLLSSPAQLQVISQPSLWTARKLFYMVGVLLVILVLSTVWISQLQRQVEQRTRQLQQEVREREVAERERALESERSRIARDLHDDLGSSLTEIKVLANRGHRLGVTNELTALFGGIAGKARELVTNLDIIVWAVDSERNSLESTTDYLTDFASECLSHSGIVCRFDIPVTLPSVMLDGRVRHDLLLAVKETLNNIVRHSQATEVVFRMTFAENQFKINISDNGKGFDTQAKHGGHGLKNLPLRLSKVGGRYNIESCMGKGTNVSIELRVSPQPVTMPESVPS